MSKKNIETMYPLYPSQQGMLFATLANPHSGIYIEQSLWRMSGELDITAFQHAWERVVERHASLRTCFVWQNQKEPLQVVLQQVTLPFEQEDWSDLSGTQQQEKRAEYLQRTRIEGFSLSKAPLLRLALFRLDQETFQFVLTFHHILMDGWCLPLIMKDVLALYAALRQEQEVLLPPPRPYVEYIRWLKHQDITQAQTFWHNRLQGITEPTPLGKAARSEDIGSREPGYGEQAVSLPVSDTTALQSLVNQHRLTLNSLVQGVWGLLLSRYSGQNPVVFGATVSGRPPDLPGVESIVGFFINTIPVRVTISPETPFHSWIQTFQTQQLEQQAHEYCSSGQIHQWSGMPGSLPLYESILVFENYPVELSELIPSGLSIEFDDFQVIGAQTAYALTILVTPGTELEVKLVYNRRRFDESGIEAILRHFIALLQSIIADPARSLALLLETIPENQIPAFVPLPHRVQQESPKPVGLPETPAEQALAALWKEILGIEQIGIHQNFFELGGHSLVAMRLTAEIQQQFGQSLPLTTFFQTPTIARLARLLDQSAAPATFTPLVGIQPLGNKLPFFCVHAVDGGVFYYADLARRLGSDQPFYGLQAYGLEPGTPVLNNVEEMAVSYIEAILAEFPQGPYLIGGYSSGGIHAYEIARQLRQAGKEVALLVLIDMPPYYTVFEAANHFLALMRMIGEYLRTDLVQLYCQARGLDAEQVPSAEGAEQAPSDLSLSQAVCQDLQHLSSRERLELLGNCIRDTGALPPGVTAERMERITNVFTATSEAVQNYRVQPYEGRTVLFRSIDDLRKRIQEPDYSWGQYISPPVEAYDVPGDHFTIIREPNVKVLAEHLTGCLSV